MKNNYFTYYKPNAIIGLILILGSILGFGLTCIIKYSNNLDISYYQYPSTGLLLGGVIWLIDKYLWNKWLVRLLFNIPDISGRYEGEIKYTNPITNKKENKICAVEIFQTGSIIKVKSFFDKKDRTEESPSKSIIEKIVKNDDGSFSLVFTYKNKGISGKFQSHYGTNILDVIKNKDGTFLKGEYYTNRIPQTQGQMRVKFITHTLKNEL